MTMFTKISKYIFLASSALCCVSCSQYVTTDVNVKDKAFSSYVLLLTGLSVAIALILIAAVFAIASKLYKLDKGRWTSLWNYLERYLSVLFVVTWVFGFCVYLVGMFIIDEPVSLWENVWHLLCVSPMAIVHAFGMFVLNSDISAVHEQFHNSLLYMTFFSLSHLLAAFVSMMFVVKHFGYNLVARVQLWVMAWKSAQSEQLFIFWGTNEASFTLAHNIKCHKELDGKYHIIIIRTASDEEETSERTGLERLFNFLSLKNKELAEFKGLNCMSANTFSRLSKLNFSDIQAGGHVHILREILNLKSVVKIIRKTDKHVHIFMLDEDEDSNIRAVANISQDADLQEYASEAGKKVTIYLHARYDSVNRVVEDQFSHEGFEVKVVDTAHDSINLLKTQLETCPISFVDIDTTDILGTIKSPFECMVLGFGETGQDAVRFLYEFGAFVTSDKKKVNTSQDRSAFHCTVYDTRADVLRERFFAGAPALKQSGLIDILNDAVFSDKFYDCLQKKVHDINYIVVCLGDDELNISVAVRLFNYVRSRRSDLSKFKILVRNHDNSKQDHLKNIARHYNECYKRISGTNCVANTIEVFGTMDSLFTYEHIVENSYEAEGHIYNETYCKVSGNNGIKDRWVTRREFLLEQRSLNSLSELRRKEAQDISNAYHAKEKIYIMKRVAEAKGLTRLLQCFEGEVQPPVFCRTASKSGDPIKGEIKDVVGYSTAEQQLFDNIAHLEHIRWNASHEALGYQSYEDGDKEGLLVKEEKRHSCNEQYKLHNCLVSWRMIDAESRNAATGSWNPDYKLYDYAVITTTLKLMGNTVS